MSVTANPAPADILLVDDTPANLNVLSTILAQQGYKVRPANSGLVALRVAQHASPDLILLDIQMPGMDGFEVCRRLKALEHTRDTPVIFISALDEALDKVAAFEAGGVDYIAKPFQILEVLARVQYQLTLRQQRAQLAELRGLIGRIQAPSQQLAGELAALSLVPGAPSAEQFGQLATAAQLLDSVIAEIARVAGVA